MNTDPVSEKRKAEKRKLIRREMLENAARIWGVEEGNIEFEFDPVVINLIEACSFGLSNINEEIISTQSRILERLAQVLSPETLTAPQPAHAIVHARSTEPSDILNRDAQFFTIKEIEPASQSQKKINKEVYFSPVSGCEIYDADIKYVAHSNWFYKYKTPLVFEKNELETSLDPSSMWIGIEINPGIISIKNLGFYFNWKDDVGEDNIINLLPLTKWYIDGRQLNVSRGITYSEKSAPGISDEFNVTHKTEELIKFHYRNHFYTINDPVLSGGNIQHLKILCPAELDTAFSKILPKITESCLWLKLQFTTAFPPDALKNISIAINAFPVINRRLIIETPYSLQKNLNIIPLKTDDWEMFFDILNVENAEGKQFISNPLNSGLKNKAGFYTFRYKGVERFDDRHAGELLDNILDLLRDEIAAFDALHPDSIDRQIGIINPALSKIREVVEREGQRNKPGYFIFINPFKPNEEVFINFWTTNGKLANNLSPYSRLYNSSGAETQPATLMLLTPVSGGKDALNENEKIIAYKKALLTRDRIVTEQDIRAACFYELGDLIREISIKKNWEVVNHCKEGIRRVLEINIVPAKNKQLSEDEWRNLTGELKSKLEFNSSSFIPIRISVSEER